MNAASAIILALVVALAVFAVWRNLKKGAPCECGGNKKLCGGGGGKCSCCG